MTQQTTLRQIRWRCHRGMLELDCILINFFDKQFSQLPDTEQDLFVELLEQQDPTLWQWFTTPQDAEPYYHTMVEKILDAVQTNGATAPTH